MGEPQRMECILLDQKHRQALAGIQIANDLEYLLHDERRQSEGGLIEEQQAGARHQSAGYGQHLLLAAGKRPAALALALFEDGKNLEGATEILREVPLIADGGTHLKIFQDRHARKDRSEERRVGKECRSRWSAWY